MKSLLVLSEEQVVCEGLKLASTKDAVSVVENEDDRKLCQSIEGLSKDHCNCDVYPPNTNLTDVLTAMHQSSPHRRSVVLGDSANAACILERTHGGVMASAIRMDNQNKLVDTIVRLCAGTVVPQAVCFISDDSSFSQITQFLYDHLHEPVGNLGL